MEHAQKTLLNTILNLYSNLITQPGHFNVFNQIL